ncbi:MAG: hypothetical protein ACI30R_02965, partial [Sodaliphilus sp.]
MASHHHAVTSVPHISLFSFQVRLIPAYTRNTNLKVSRASHLVSRSRARLVSRASRLVRGSPLRETPETLETLETLETPETPETLET